MPESFIDLPQALKVAIAVFTASLVAIITTSSLWLWLQPPDDFARHKKAFQLVMTQTLLPLFTALASTVLAYIFAKIVLRGIDVYATTRQSK
jgi:ABC-type amino acid transport system permease subunit